MLPIILLLLISAIHYIQAQLDKFKQSTGYVDVREGAHMFYWLYYTTAPVKNYTERPLIIWFNGGPGNSATGFGNYISVGPFNSDMTEKNGTMIDNFNVMFLDNPVGTGFSYVDDPKLLTKTNLEIATDFMVFIQKFYEKNPEFEAVPLYLYGISYASKMAVEMAIKLKQAEKKRTIKSNLRGIFMQDPWVSPLDHVRAWPRMLKFAALVEKDGYDKVVKAVKETERLYNIGQYAKSRIQRNTTIDVMVNATDAIDKFNIFNGAITSIPNTSNDGHYVNSTYNPPNDDPVNTLFNGVVKKKFNIPEKVKWYFSNDAVYTAHIGDFMIPVIDGIEKLLNETDISLTVLNGNNDLIYSTIGQVSWINKLKWPGAKKFNSKRRQPIWVNDRLEGYYKKYRNFGFYEMNGEGQDITQYNPDTVRAILRDVTTFG